MQGSLRLQLPVPQERLTAIGVYGSGDGALGLKPLGTRGNQGFLSRAYHRVFGGGGHGGLSYYGLGGVGGDTALEVGAAAGTDVYSPVDGTITGLTPFVVDGQTYGQEIQIQPLSNPSVVVSLTQILPDPALAVSSSVAAGTTKIGSVVDMSKVERQALAHYTQDAGNHVTLEVLPAATLSIP
jgi:hypothetical protein